MWKFFVKCREDVFQLVGDDIRVGADGLEISCGTEEIACFHEWVYWYKERVVIDAETKQA